MPEREAASQQLAALSWFAVGKGEREGSRGMGGALAGSAEAMQEVKQVVGVLAGVEADEEVGRPVSPGDLLETRPEQRTTGCGLG